MASMAHRYINFQLLAALLITRQVMGNIKEALIPYVKQQLRFAKLSFDLYGGNLSPDRKKDDDSETNTIVDDDSGQKNLDSVSQEEPEINERKLSQVEMESSRPAVKMATYKFKAGNNHMAFKFLDILILRHFDLATSLFLNILIWQHFDLATIWRLGSFSNRLGHFTPFQIKLG